MCPSWCRGGGAVVARKTCNTRVANSSLACVTSVFFLWQGRLVHMTASRGLSVHSKSLTSRGECLRKMRSVNVPVAAFHVPCSSILRQIETFEQIEPPLSNITACTPPCSHANWKESFVTPRAQRQSLSCFLDLFG